MKRENKKWIVIILLAAIFNPMSLVIMGIGVARWSDAHPDTGENESSVDWLPDGATQVSYYRSYSRTAYEFDISEPDFIEWASAWDIREIETPFTIRRHKLFLEDPPDYDPDPDGPYYAFESEAKITITNGYFYRTPPRGNCGGTYVAYDRGRSRAYYQMNPR